MRKCARNGVSSIAAIIQADEKKGAGMPESKFEWQTNPVRIGPRPPLALAARGGGRRAFSGPKVSLSAN